MKGIVLHIIVFVAWAESRDPLILTPYIKNGDIQLARQLSEVSSDKFLGLKSYSGFITVNEACNSNLFFWYFPLANDAGTVPWVLWLNGGPGVTSLLGLFEGIGPLEIEDGKVKLRNVTWASDYSLLFVDSPAGVGYSFTESEEGYTSSLDEVSAQLYEFLQVFLTVFPELRAAPLFIAGESYAGKYVPGLGAWIHRHRNSGTPVNLKGIAIGNGMIDPKSSMLYSSLTQELGLLEDEQIVTLQVLEQRVLELIDKNDIVAASNEFNETIEYIKKETGVNIYNFLEDTGRQPMISPDLNPFLESVEMREAIHVGNVSFDINNQVVYQHMLADIMNSSKQFVEQLLENGYGVLCYSGQLDLILPYGLSKRTYNLLHWSGREAYASAMRRTLRLKANDGFVDGYCKEGGNFTEVLIRGAGHMVTKEKPDTLKYVIDTFIAKYK